MTRRESVELALTGGQLVRHCDATVLHLVPTVGNGNKTVRHVGNELLAA